MRRGRRRRWLQAMVRHRRGLSGELISTCRGRKWQSTEEEGKKHIECRGGGGIAKKKEKKLFALDNSYLGT